MKDVDLLKQMIEKDSEQNPQLTEIATQFAKKCQEKFKQK